MVGKCLGLTRVRNESPILQETLDHFSSFCDQGIVVVDDASTDGSAEIAERHESVVSIIRNRKWSPYRPAEEWRLRQIALDEGRRWSPDWFLAFDADERIEPSSVEIGEEVDSIAMRLFDAYITSEDSEVVGTTRRWFGPEYRDIVMFFRNVPDVSYWLPDQRVVAGLQATVLGGYARHFGKAISLAEYDLTCEYYARFFPEPYRSKWQARKGNGIHSMSDFGRPLYPWPDVVEHGIMLHDASSPMAAPGAIRSQMLLVRENDYLCTECGAPLIAVQDGISGWMMTCPEGHDVGGVIR